MWSALFDPAIQEDFEFLLGRFKTVCRLWQSARKYMFACLQLFSEQNDDGEGYSVWCCHTGIFVLLLMPIQDSVHRLGLWIPVRK